MIFLGHVGITLFFATLLSLAILFALLGAVLPDFFDKILFVLGVIPCGRYFGHSIFFAPFVGLVTYAATKRKDFTIAIVFGSYFHLLQDAQYFLPLFIPFMNYNFDCKMPLSGGVEPLTVFFEILGLLLIIIVMLYRSKLMQIGNEIKSKFRQVYISKKIININDNMAAGEKRRRRKRKKEKKKRR